MAAAGIAETARACSRVRPRNRQSAQDLHASSRRWARPRESGRASSMPCSGPTAPARRRRCAWSAVCCGRMPDRISIFGIDALREPIAAKRVTAWVSDEPMIYDKLTPFEYLEFVAGLWTIDGATAARRAEGAHRHPRPRAPCAFSLRGVLQGHAPEGGAGRRSGPRAAPHHPRRAVDRPRRGLGPRWSRTSCSARSRDGCTIIMTTHILEVAERMAERIGVIAAGRLIAEGTLERAARARLARGAPASRRSSSSSSPSGSWRHELDRDAGTLRPSRAAPRLA